MTTLLILFASFVAPPTVTVPASGCCACCVTCDCGCPCGVGGPCTCTDDCCASCCRD